MLEKKIEDDLLEEMDDEKKEPQTIHDHHMHALFALFCFVALLGISAVFVHQYAGDGITGAFTTTVNYNSCSDYGNYIVLKNDAGWKKIKKDICTGFEKKYIQKAACVIPERKTYTTTEQESYVYTYTEIASCENGLSCVLDENGAAYCSET